MDWESFYPSLVLQFGIKFKNHGHGLNKDSL